VTGRAAAAIRFSLATNTDDLPTPRVHWLGQTIVVLARLGAIRVELATARVLCAPQRIFSFRMPEDVAIAQLRSLAGMECEETELLHGAPVGLAAPIRLGRLARPDAPAWETCAALGPVVLTLL